MSNYYRTLLMNLTSYPIGIIDTTFTSGTGFNGDVFFLVILSNDYIILVGSFTSYNGTTSNRIIKLTSTGSIDSSFNIGTGANNIVGDMVIDSIGNIIICGSFTSYNGNTRNGIARLLSTGVIDSSYTPVGPGAGTSISDIAIQTNNYIIVGGGFTTFNGVSKNRIVRLDTTGSIDSSFNIGTGFNDNPLIITVDISGNIFIGGSFTSYNGTTSNRIIKLTSTGSIDSSFNIGTGFNSLVYDIKVQGDGNILVGGSFTSYNGTAVSSIVRLTPIGVIDSSFTPPSITDFVSVIKLQTDNKILLGSGTLGSSYGIFRLNTNGSIDSSFDNTGLSPGDYSSVLDIQSNNKIIVGGSFNSYNGTTVNNIVRLQ